MKTGPRRLRLVAGVVVLLILILVGLVVKSFLRRKLAVATLYLAVKSKSARCRPCRVYPCGGGEQSCVAWIAGSQR